MEGVSSEESRCTLVGELVQVLEMVRQLDAHMTGMQLGGGGGWVAGGEERCRALVATMRASIDRSVQIARSFYAAERSPAGRLLPVFAAGHPESPPSGGGDGDGSPRSTGSDQAGGESRGHSNATGQSKKRKTLPKWSTKVRVSAVQDVTPLDDGLSWRKYGQKDILGAKYPRAYFRCTHRHTQGCQASKQVQRADGDPLLFDVVYHGDHTCAQVQAQAAAHLGNTTANAENSQQQPQSAAGLEQATSASSSQMFERTVLPMIPTNNKPAANDSAFETSGGFPAAGCLIAASCGFTATATTKPESQLVSSSGSNHTAVGAPPNNVPEVELASTTNSPIMGDDMDFLFSLDDAAGFLENTSYNF